MVTYIKVHLKFTHFCAWKSFAHTDFTVRHAHVPVCFKTLTSFWEIWAIEISWFWLAWLYIRLITAIPLRHWWWLRHHLTLQLFAPRPSHDVSVIYICNYWVDIHKSSPHTCSQFKLSASLNAIVIRPAWFILLCLLRTLRMHLVATSWREKSTQCKVQHMPRGGGVGTMVWQLHDLLI